MIANALKTAAIATVLVVATAGTSMAATWAWVDHDAKVRKNPGHIGPAVNWVHEGQKVKVVGMKKGYFKVQIPGQDGWVHGDVLEFNNYKPVGYPYGYGYPYGGGAQFCADGKKVDFCFGIGF